jgi:hypothetical protein
MNSRSQAFLEERESLTRFLTKLGFQRTGHPADANSRHDVYVIPGTGLSVETYQSLPEPTRFRWTLELKQYSEAGPPDGVVDDDELEIDFGVTHAKFAWTPAQRKLSGEIVLPVLSKAVPSFSRSESGMSFSQFFEKIKQVIRLDVRMTGPQSISSACNCGALATQSCVKCGEPVCGSCAQK